MHIFLSLKQNFYLQRSRWPRGRVLGGSSTLNYMLYVRGNRKDYDNWEAMGAKGWSWNDVFPYFLKSEDNRDPPLVESGNKYIIDTKLMDHVSLKILKCPSYLPILMCAL